MKANQSPSYLRWLMVAPTCALLAVSSLLAQQANPSAAAPAAAPSEEVVKMNPFQVQASTRDVGYYAENTLAGSRLNTNVGDLASSITVVTKQQMLDTASVNINDIFMYEANTEGANTYMPLFLNRTAARDTIGGYSQDAGGAGMGVATANRIRGLDVSDVAINNYPSSSRIPFDAYNTSSVEINRGPNSLLFGTGSPAGITNQSTNSAVLGQRKTEVTYQFGRWGTYRGTISHNQPLGDKLALYVAALYTHNGYERKPSYDIYRRQYGALTYQPFKGTRITASFENFDNNNRRPNYVLPRDAVTPWLAAGRPAWNPVTQMMTILDTGQVLGPYLTDTRDARYAATIAAYPALSQTLLPSTARIAIGNSWLSALTSPLYVRGITLRSAHNYMMINQGAMVGYWEGQPSGTAAPTFPTGIGAVTGRTQQDWILATNRPTWSNFDNAPLLANGTAKYATWIIPGVTNRAIYDWQSINSSSINFGQIGAKTYNIELQQEILTNLNLDVGWFRQEIVETDNYPLGEANQINSIYIDTNIVNADGSPNPYFGSPLQQDYQQDTFKTPEINNNFRVMLSYEKDFTTNKGWTRWLGRHRLLGLWSRQEDNAQNVRYRLAIDGGDTRYLPNSATAGWTYFSSNTVGDRFFYMGKNQQGVVQYAPGIWNPPLYGGIGAAAMSTYNFQTHAYEPANVSFEPVRGTQTLNQKVLESQNFAWQGFFLNNRVVGTVGWRKDDFRARQTTNAGLTGSQQDVNGFVVESNINRMSNWFYLRGRTKTAGVVVRPLVWSSGSLGVHLNRSNNFNPPNGTLVDFFGKPLGKPQGSGKDYGIDLTLFDNKLVARINWFKSDNQNAPATNASTAIGRVQRIDTSSMRPWAEWVVRIRNGDDINAFFGNNTVHPLTTTEISQIEALMNSPNYSYVNNSWGYTPSATQEDLAKGLEAQVIYNPMRNWNIKLTVGKQRSTYMQVAPELDAWLANRMPIWTSVVATDIPNEILVTKGAAGSGTTQTLLSNFWNGYGFSPDAQLSNLSGTTPAWTTPHGFYDNVVGTEIAVAKALQGQNVSNERIWSWNLISNYAFTSGWLRGASFGGAIRWEDKAIAGYLGDTVNLNGNGQISKPDITLPIYTPSQTHVDVWASYTTKIPKLFGDKVQVRFQLNVRDLTEKGGLQAIAFNFDGSKSSFRIVDPRQYYFTTTLDF